MLLSLFDGAKVGRYAEKVEKTRVLVDIWANKYGFLGRCFIDLGKERLIYKQQLHDQHLYLPKMTKYIKEIIEQI